MEGFWQDIFNRRTLESALTSDEGLDHVAQTITANITRLLIEDPDCGPDNVINCGSSLLNLFCRLNWIGPFQSDLACPYIDTRTLCELNSKSLEALSWDGEAVYPLCRHPLLLYLAHTVLVENSTLLGQKAVWWILRCLFVEQRVLSQRSATLWSKISHLIEGDIKHLLEEDELSKEKKCELHLELCHVVLYYSQYQGAKVHVSSAREAVGLRVELSGALGKRTKYQEKDVAQMRLVVDKASERGGQAVEKGDLAKKIIPKDLQLQDDTLLEHVAYSDLQATHTTQLTALEQAVILGQCICQLKSLPVDRLGYEEAEAFVQCVLSQPQVWCVQCVALFLRCQTERQRRRTAERAMLQLEELTQAYSMEKDESALDLFFCLPVPPVWAVEKEYADVLLSMGAAQSALEVYERLEMWEEVAECSSVSGRGGKVREVARERLEKGQATPTLLCVLGDVTRNPEDYRRAWEISGGRCGRAQRSLGLYHLRRKEYKESIAAFDLSLKINSLQENIWFSMGCAAQQVGDEELAIKAFHRCVSLEADFAEGWNNLATLYLKKSEKVKAFRAFQEALKCSYNNWKIWENLLVVSTDIGELRQALQAYHHILDLQNKFIDIEILRCLVTAVVDGRSDRSGQPASRLRKSAGELLGKITSQVTGSADVWELYADYHLSSTELLDHEKGLLELQKAQRCARQTSGWDREWAGLERAAQLTLKYCHTCQRLCEVRGDSSKSLQTLSSAKFALQGIITKTKGFGVVMSEEQTQLIGQLEGELSRLLQLMAQLETKT